ncbi:hypothetical protein FRC19_001270 [Serendipita sp. 401]|nr:hypothetical protein FRC19_001270 [Serendipita sp. 401]
MWGYRYPDHSGSFRRTRSCWWVSSYLLPISFLTYTQALRVLPILLQRLHEENIIVADLGGEDNDELEAKYMGLCRRSPVDRVRRIDILTIPFEQWGAALVYFTGDDIFNRSMRLLANKKGMSLNQRGLYDGVVRDPKTRLKTAVGRIIASRTEQEIFRALGVPWQEPHERVRA